MNFGNIDVTSGGAFQTTGTYIATCSGLATATRTCPSIGEGSGGSSSGAPRYLLNGSHRLSYNLHSDAGSTVWGSYFWAFSARPPAVDIGTVLLGNGSMSRTITAIVSSGQQGVPAGIYTSSFAGTETRIPYAAFLLGIFAPACSTLSSPFGTAPFTVTATVPSSCTVSATKLDFGATGSLAVARDSTNTISVTCTNGTPYVVALDGGLTHATDPAQRKMSLAGEKITYGLYRNAARTLAWGSTTGTDTLSLTGTGAAQVQTVYGQVSSQSTPTPGTYTDTIIVTVTY